MQPFLTLYRRELGNYFVSITGYMVVAGVQLITGLCLAFLLESLNGRAFDQPATEVFYGTGFFWVVVLMAAPVVTMRSFAYEKGSGTFETLMTAPVDDLEVVLAKFCGALSFYMLLWVPVAIYPYILSRYTAEPITLEPGVMASSVLGIFLIGCLFVSIGCFSSSLTRNQLVAATNTFAIGMVLFLFSLLPLLKPMQSGWQYAVAAQISMVEHMKDFSHGVVDTGHVMYYVTLTIFFLFLNVKVVESRRWK